MGVRLSSNGLGWSGRCSNEVSLRTSDPQEPQTPVNFSATPITVLPSQSVPRGGRFLCGEMRGVLQPVLSPPAYYLVFKFSKYINWSSRAL